MFLGPGGGGSFGGGKSKTKRFACIKSYIKKNINIYKV